MTPYRTIHHEVLLSNKTRILPTQTKPMTCYRTDLSSCQGRRPMTSPVIV